MSYRVIIVYFDKELFTFRQNSRARIGLQILSDNTLR